MELYTQQRISDRIIRITMPGRVYSYLAYGTKRAALIDTGCGIAGLRDYVASLTALPLTVIVTHGHFDHAGGVGEFNEVYLPPEDMELCTLHNSSDVRTSLLRCLPDIKQELMAEPVPFAPKHGFLPLHDGDRFDLGGTSLLVHALPGHTPGSMCVEFCGENKLLLGDACCSATHLDFPECLSVEDYLKSVQTFREKLGYYSGECFYSHPHNYGDLRILKQMEELCEDVLSGTHSTAVQKGICLAKPVDEARRRLDGKIANLIYRADNIRKGTSEGWRY